MLNKPEPSADASDAVIIKKYANRRLYNTETSTYVTLEDLAAMVRANRDFVVYDAKSGDDLTHTVLTQIIVEQEARAGTQTLLPVPFLRQLIRYYDDALGKMVPGYLQFSLDALAKENEKFRAQMANAFGNPAKAFDVYQDQARKNLEMFEQAMSMWASLGPGAGTSPAGDASSARDEAGPPAGQAGASAGGKAQSQDSAARSDGSPSTEIDALKAELARVSEKLEALSKDKDN